MCTYQGGVCKYQIHHSGTHATFRVGPGTNLKSKPRVPITADSKGRVLAETQLGLLTWPPLGTEVSLPPSTSEFPGTGDISKQFRKFVGLNCVCPEVWVKGGNGC